jgi:hypothetical protein
MKIILIWFGLKRSTSSENQKLSYNFKSTYPENQPSKDEWMKEFRVSMLYGREAVYM